MNDHLAPPPVHPLTTPDWLDVSRPDVLVVLLLCLGTATLLAWNLMWAVLATLASTRMVPRHLRRLLARAVRTAGTEHSRRMLLRMGAAATLGAGALTACAESPPAAPLGDDLSWGAALSSSSPTPRQVSSPAAVEPPAVYPPPVADTSAEPPPPAPVTHTVEAGDTLWGIASELLGPGADDAQITATWHLIHEQNRTLIGEDPDLIRPGWVLSLDGVTP